MSDYKKILKSWETPFDKTSDQAWNELQARISKEGVKSALVVRFSWKPMVSVAAAAAVIIGLVIAWPDNELIIKRAGMASQEVFTLPDMSTATLNAGSEITFDEDWSDERTLKLQGQAFFEVIKGSRFSVVTDQGIVEVLGTSFDVFARDDRFIVKCKTGRVKVSAGKNSVEITPGNQAELSGNMLAISKFDLADADWQSGEFVYSDEPLNHVFEEIERQFNVVISSPDVSAKRYSGRFSDKDLEKALELVCIPMGLDFSIEGENQVVIRTIQH